MNKSVVLVAFLLLVSAKAYSDDIFASDTYVKIGDRYASIVKWRQMAGDCRQNSQTRRGEYETKQEYEERKKNAVSACSIYSPFKGEVIEKPGLRYYVDQGQFRFQWPIRGGGGRKRHYDQVFSEHRIRTSLHGGVLDYEPTFFDGKPEVSTSRGSIWLTVDSRVEKARALKAREESLSLRFDVTVEFTGNRSTSGTYVPRYVWTVDRIRIFNSETDENVMLVD